MKPSIYFMIIVLCSLVTSCEDYVDVEVPDQKITRETIFTNDETALSAMKGIYNELFNAYFSNGWTRSVTVLAGLSADIIEPIGTENSAQLDFAENEIMPDNALNLNLWSSAYNIIYMANSLLEGVEDSKKITNGIRRQLQGEARFVRAFTYFYLVNLYGEIPLVLTTDYRENAVVPKNGTEEIYGQIEADLDMAIEFLDPDHVDAERIYLNKFAVMAMRARVYLYRENWIQAEALSGQVIGYSEKYRLLNNLDGVFLANSSEAIWQISPVGRGGASTYTFDGQSFIGTARSTLKLADNFVGSLNPADHRTSHWTGFFSNDINSFYYPYKYKDGSSSNNITEYSMVLRLAEQYLIRAEARIMQDDFHGAIADLDKLRSRANISPIKETSLRINRKNLLKEIMDERKMELFSEWGHRWLDLKRTGRASEELKNIKAFWQPTDALYPIPQLELMRNPHLVQNPGY